MSAIGLAFLLLCAAILILVALIFIAFLASEASIERLRPLSLSAANNHSRNADNVPSISVIFAARNEELSIEQATRSMLALDYPNMELIVVDDRSTDQTPSILLRLKQEFPDALQTIRVELLPHEWLGKCHALHVGAQSARGEWLLFTDADIHMHPSTLQTTLDFASRKKADHLTLAPYCNMPSWILNTFVATFAFLFKAFVKPNQISNPKSSAHVGVGAFNLVRRSTYQAIGGHASVRLCPDDDVKLGKRIKLAGFQQRFANGMDLIRVPWYAWPREKLLRWNRLQHPNMDRVEHLHILFRDTTLVASSVCDRHPLAPARYRLCSLAVYRFDQRHSLRVPNRPRARTADRHLSISIGSQPIGHPDTHSTRNLLARYVLLPR